MDMVHDARKSGNGPCCLQLRMVNSAAFYAPRKLISTEFMLILNFHLRAGEVDNFNPAASQV
jgi:hypothetical protein